MATYATVANFESLVPGWVTTSAVELEKLLLRAERDIDAYLGGAAPVAAGTRYQPLLLTA